MTFWVERGGKMAERIAAETAMAANIAAATASVWLDENDKNKVVGKMLAETMAGASAGKAVLESTSVAAARIWHDNGGDKALEVVKKDVVTGAEAGKAAFDSAIASADALWKEKGGKEAVEKTAAQFGNSMNDLGKSARRWWIGLGK